MVSSTLKLGISILNGGNSDVQQVRLIRKTGEVLFRRKFWTGLTRLCGDKST